MARSGCGLCMWRSRDWRSRDAAVGESMWHLFEQHQVVWRALVGPNQPRDPDPRVQVHNVHGWQ